MQSTPRFKTRFIRAAPVLLLALIAAGCGWAHGNGENGSTVGWKTVMRKVEPAYLIAVDRSQCTVSPERFAKAEEGKGFFCAWSGGAVATRPKGSPYPGEDVGIPRSPDQPHVPPPSTPPHQPTVQEH